MKNTLSKRKFILDNILYGCFALYLYRKMLFRRIGTLTMDYSNAILMVIMISAIVLGMYVQMDSRRSKISVFVNIAWGLGLYTLLTYFQVFRSLYLIVLLSSIIFCVIDYIVLMKKRFRTKSGRLVKPLPKTLCRRRKKAFFASQKIIAAGLAVAMLLIFSNALFGRRLLNASTPATVSSISGGETTSKNIATLSLLREEQWVKLTPMEKLNVLQTVANIEQHYFGLPHELTVSADNLGKNVGGDYNDRFSVITINLDCLQKQSSWELVKTICHEAFHSYEYMQVQLYDEAKSDKKDLLIFNDAKKYKRDFATYVSAETEEQFDEYYFQTCEIDARLYSVRAVAYYKGQIESYLADNVKDDHDEYDELIREDDAYAYG